MKELPQAEYEQFQSLQQKIKMRLADFQRVPHARWINEIAFCLLTPQSSARNAACAIGRLEEEGFFQGALSTQEVGSILGNRESYVRFHNTKARRLVDFREWWGTHAAFFNEGNAPVAERDYLLQVSGLGLKETSHALRNIGRRGLTILDRHILRELVAHGVIKSFPNSLSVKRYRELEQDFLKFAQDVSIPVDELDLFFWAKATGEVFK